LKIENIQVSSPLYGKILPGDILLSINSHPLRDLLDYLYLSEDQELHLEVLRSGEVFRIEVEIESPAELGLTPAQMKPRLCGNHCLFCFVDQNPPGVRKSLLIKDEDYRFSFLHGNFITLSNLSRNAIKRIIEYRLSPLFISVHSMDMEARNRLLNRKTDDGFRKKFLQLIQAGITLHTQIVIVPGYNDGQVLEDTIAQAGDYFPAVASIGLIPVGLTKYRQHLTPLVPVDKELARKIIALSAQFRLRFLRKYCNPLVYAADEMFLLAQEPLPDVKYYREFPQIGNGVGMVRYFLRQFNLEKRKFPRKFKSIRKILLVTGTAMAPVLRAEVKPVLQKIQNARIEIIEVKNDFFGHSVTVAGLLGGRDILKTIENCQADLIILPTDCVNCDGFFLDDLKFEDLKRRVRGKVEVFSGSFSTILKELK
jgi:putative radical SAM enzyme (TIGR03279 family)